MELVFPLHDLSCPCDRSAQQDMAEEALASLSIGLRRTGSVCVFLRGMLALGASPPGTQPPRCGQRCEVESSHSNYRRG